MAKCPVCVGDAERVNLRAFTTVYCPVCSVFKISPGAEVEMASMPAAARQAELDRAIADAGENHVPFIQRG